MIGGISYFHTYAYDLLATNERIIAAVVRRRDRRAPRRARSRRSLHELVDGVRVDRPRGRRTRATSARSRRRCRRTGSRSSPSSTSRGPRWDQYGLPYTIVRPFNCVGVGERRALGDVEVLSATSSSR